MKPDCPNCQSGSCKHIEENKMTELQEIVEAVSNELSVIAEVLEKLVYKIEVLEEDTNAMALQIHLLEEKSNRFFEEQRFEPYIVEYDLSDKNVQKLKDWITSETNNS